jgi:hypothetical protein
MLVVNGSKSAIEKTIGGFSIPVSDDCFSNPRRKSVKFLHDVVNAGCGVRISEAQLQSLCSDPAAGSTLLLSVLRQNFTDLTGIFPASLFNKTAATELVDRIASTADARIEDPSSWVPVSGGSLSTFPQVAPLPYDPFRRQCSNLLVGLHYKIMVARAGSLTNPQDVIVAAFASPLVGTWVIRNDTTFDGSATTVNYVRFKVTFVRYGGTTTSTIVEAPPLLPQVDDTIFYPFRRA